MYEATRNKSMMGCVKFKREAILSRSEELVKPLSIFVLIGVLSLVLPAMSKAESFRFVVAGDTRGSNGTAPVNTVILGEIAKATIDEGAEFIIVTGDLVLGYVADQAAYEGQLTTWRDTMQSVYDAQIGVYPIRGNHDATGPKAGWDNVFTGVYSLPGNGPAGEENITYSITHKSVFVVGLDQYGTHPHRVNQIWLEAQLASNTQPHIFVFGHEPAFKVLHDDCLDDYPVDRDAFWSSIESGCARVYFTGHDHMYNHARIDDGDGNADNDLHQYIVGTDGAPLYDWDGLYDGNNSSWIPQLVYYEKEYGYVVVDVNDSDVTVTWKHRVAPGMYEAAGDTFSYVSACGAGCSTWDEVIGKYNVYVSGQISWSDVFNCYGEYVSQQ